jgi:hypothetical protein
MYQITTIRSKIPRLRNLAQDLSMQRQLTTLKCLFSAGIMEHPVSMTFIPLILFIKLGQEILDLVEHLHRPEIGIVQ